MTNHDWNGPIWEIKSYVVIFYKIILFHQNRESYLLFKFIVTKINLNHFILNSSMEQNFISLNFHCIFFVRFNSS